MKSDIYEGITARVVQQLEAGTVPWRKPWSGGPSGHPRNLASQRPYRGVNVFLLGCSPFELPFWLSFRQARALGGHVRRGEKATLIVFWRWLEREDGETGELRRFPLLRQFSVFNVEQCELPPGTVPSLPDVSPREFEAIDACERIVAGMPDPPTILHGGAEALYRPATDTVRVPEPERFDSAETYHATMFHELVHATGHSSRLNRPEVTGDIRFGTRDYSREELVAEMGAAFLCGHAGIDNAVIESSAAYIAGWLTRLRGDKRLVVHAAAAAQKAADYVLGRQFDSENEREDSSQLAANS
ncbi:MAG: zincin-like metallopeptidase domain-containing protein [Planctomycetales bacterium]